MRILIVKMSSLGDIIHIFPVLQYLKQIYPYATIDWVVERPFAELVRAHPLVNHVFCAQTKKWRSKSFKGGVWQEIKHFYHELRQNTYDIVFDLQGNVKSAFISAFVKSAIKVGFGLFSVPEWPNRLVTNKCYNPPKGKNIREDYLFLVQSVFEDFTPVGNEGVQLNLTVQEKTQLEPVLKELQGIEGLKVLVCPGSNWANKQLSKETLQWFLHCLSKQLEVYFLFIWGNQEERSLSEALLARLPHQGAVVEKLSLPALQNLMTQVDLVLAMDSLPLHLAGTTSTPSYSVFGASSAHKYKPMGEQHKAYQGSCPYGKKFDKRCTLLRTCQTGACIKQLEGQQLFDHFCEWWSGHSV